MQLVVYGDFNCPFSCLASTRVDALLAAGEIGVDWRPVEHDPHIPVPSETVEGDLARELDREIEQIRGLLLVGEELPTLRPPRRPNTAAAIAVFARTPAHRSHELRRQLFAALWRDGTDIGDRTFLQEVDATVQSPGATVRIERWSREWRALPVTVVPSVVLDGRPFLGIDALTMLGELVERVRRDAPV